MTKKIWIKLSFLALPIIIDGFAFWEDTSASPIGGGGYDLSGFVYGWLTLIYLSIWLIYMIFSTLSQENNSEKKQHTILTIIGFICFVGCFLFFKNYLS